ncbi:MAG: TetR/AcrR family transcriptional regulator [Comamonadaceae bacterium]|nr:MAG: TetR/AcrR family transcriptional regulator [Comamonadaceae bacterium]
MKTTRQQQDATRRQIVASAVDLMTRQGFDGTTMKDIARAAGIGDATIYKYFPTKDRIVLGYLDEVVHASLADTLQAPGFASYSLQEKLQRLTDAVLERLLADREFVAEMHKVARRSPLALMAEPLPARAALRDAVASFLEAAEASGEIEPCDFKGVAGGLYTDYLGGVVAYWLADESDGFADTTQLVDLSLGVLVLTLRTGLVSRALQLGGFVLRSQMARFMQRGSGLVGVLRAARQTLDDMGTVPVRRAPATAPAAPPPPGAAAGPKPRKARTKAGGPSPAAATPADAAPATAAAPVRRTRKAAP